MTWIFVWDASPSKIFVWDTEISKVFVGDTQVRPSWRQPDSNTLLYLPFTDDILDHSWQNHTVTANWSNYTFTTRSNGSKCMSLNPWWWKTYFSVAWNDVRWVYWTSASWAYKISDAVLMWWSWDRNFIINYNASFWIMEMNQVTASGYNGGQLKLPWWFDFTGSSSTGTTYDSTDVRATSPIMHSVVFTFDGSTNTLDRYLDWVLFYRNVFTAWPRQTARECYICHNSYSTGNGRYLQAKISHIVYELWVWDASRIQQYVNLI